jgi:hypothetical protein
MQRKHTGSEEIQEVPSVGKMMTSTFCDSQGIIRLDYLE